MSNPSREDMFRLGITSPASSMSIVIGDAVKARCSACCPFCVSKTTNALGIQAYGIDQHLVNWDTVMPKFRAACRFAKTSGVTNIVLTGRGEPTLYQDEIDRYLEELAPYEFPFIELQTNGIEISRGYNGSFNREGNDGHISIIDTIGEWREMGLTHIAISMAHWDKDVNNKIYGAKVPVDLEDLFTNLNLDGFSVRACLLLMKNYVDSLDDFNSVVNLCNSWGARQLKVTTISRPSKTENEAVARWIDNHMPEHADEIIDHIIKNGHYLRTLPHGAPVFDYQGLSVCISDCMPRSNQVGNGMQPIFWPNGSLTYSWEWAGAVLL